MTKIPLFPRMATNLLAIDYLPVFSLFAQLVLCKKFPFWKGKVFHSVFAGFEYTSWVKCNKIIINLQLCSDFKIYFPNYKKGIESLFTLIWFTSHCLSITTLKRKKLFLSESASCSVVSDSLRLHGLSMEFSRPEYWNGYGEAFPFSRGSSQPRDQTQVSWIAGVFFYQLSHKGSPSIEIMRTSF